MLSLPRTQTSLFWWKCARKGRREWDACRLYPSHGPLRFTSHQSLVSRSPCKERSAWGGGWCWVSSERIRTWIFTFTIFGNLNDRHHFQQMAAARSPCRCFRTRVLHFKDKDTPLKDKKWKEKVQKNAQLSFCGGREAFHQEIVLRGIQPCFLLDGAHGLFWNATKVVKFLLNFQVHFALYGRDNYVFEREYMYF